MIWSPIWRKRWRPSASLRMCRLRLLVRLLRLLLRGFLFARFDRHVVADCASGDGTENGMMVRIVAGDTADHSAFQAARLRRCSRQQKRKSDSQCTTAHRWLPHRLSRT